MAPLAAVFGVNGAVYGSLLPRYPQIADHVHASSGQFGLALAGVGVGGVAGAAVATHVVRALGGPLRALMVAGVTFLGAAVAVAAAPTLGMLALAFAALGLCDGFVDTAMNQAGAALRDRRGASVMGRLHASLAAATLLGTAAGAAVAGALSVLTHIATTAGLLLVVLLAALHALHAEDAARADATAVNSPDLNEWAVPEPVGRSMRGRGLWWAVLATAGLAAVLVELPAQEWSGLLLARELSASPTVAGAGPLVAVAGVLLGRLALDRVVDAFGWRTVVRLAGGLTAIGTFAALALGAATRDPAPLLIGLGVSAVGAGAAAPLLFDRAGQLAGHLGMSTDAGPGLVSGAFRVGVLASPLLVGGIAERAGLFLALGVAGVAGATLACLAGPLTRDHPR